MDNLPCTLIIPAAGESRRFTHAGIQKPKGLLRMNWRGIERTMIEHKLAHISQRPGNDARYVGVRKNTFDLRRASAIQNLETLHLAEVQSRKVA